MSLAALAAATAGAHGPEGGGGRAGRHAAMILVCTANPSHQFPLAPFTFFKGGPCPACGAPLVACNVAQPSPQPASFGGFPSPQPSFPPPSQPSFGGFGSAYPAPSQPTFGGFGMPSAPPPSQPTFGGFGMPSMPPPQGFGGGFPSHLQPVSSSSPFGGFPSSSPPATTATQPSSPTSRPLTFIDYSQRPIGYTPSFQLNGTIDFNQLSAGVARPRFEYTTSYLNQPGLGPISGPEMQKYGATFAPAAPAKQVSNQYIAYTKSAGMSPAQKAQVPTSTGASARGIHHKVKGAERLVVHMDGVGREKGQFGATDQVVTEAGGEFAAAGFMASLHDDYEMKLGFVKGKGIDQIWVRRDGQGNITEYLIVEAKGYGVGGQEAKLQDTGTKGWQMSQRWVVQTLWDYSKSTTFHHLNRLAEKMLTCISQPKGVLVWGVCVTEQSDRSTVKVRDCGPYNFSHPNAGAVPAGW